MQDRQTDCVLSCVRFLGLTASAAALPDTNLKGDNRFALN